MWFENNETFYEPSLWLSVTFIEWSVPIDYEMPVKYILLKQIIYA